MLYDNYKRKILSVGQVLRVIVKFLPLIIIVTAAVTVISATLVATKGIVSDVKLPAKPVEYGDPIPCHASAFLSDVTYEYSTDNATWTTTYPNKPGKYYVRAVGDASFGGKRYSDTVAFEIKKREITVTVPQSGEIEYGSLEVFAKAASGDRVECEELEFDLTTLKEKDDNTVIIKATPVKSKIKIFDSRGNDITSYYNISVEAFDIDIVKRQIDITVANDNKIYDGKKFTFDTYNFKNSELVEGDSLIATYPESQVDPGNQTVTPEFKAMNADGIDVTPLYKFNITSGTLTIEKRPLVLELGAFESMYTGGEIVSQLYSAVTSDDSLPLLNGHKIQAKEGITYPTDVGTHNNPTVFAVVDSEGNDVTDKYYSVIQKAANIVITKRGIHVKPSDTSKIYDASPLYATEIEVAESTLNPLAEGHTLSFTGSMAANITDVDKITHKIEDVSAVKVMSGDRDVTANYEIICAEGSIEVTKRDIEVSPLADQRKSYDGRPFVTDKVVFTPEDNENNAGLITTNALHNVTVVAPYSTVSSDFGDDYGWLLKPEDVRIYCEETDVTANYNISTPNEPVKISIKKNTLYVKPKDVKAIYDGQKHAATQIEFAEGSLGLIDLGFSLEYTGSMEVYSSNENRGFSFVHIPKSEIEYIKVYLDGKDVTANYEIDVTHNQTAGRITIEPRPINIDPVLEDKIYDGQLLSSDKAVSVNESAENSIGLVSGHVIETTEFKSNSTYTGSYTWELADSTVTIKNADGKKVTENYVITFGTATADIQKRPITVTPILSGKVYDGSAIQSTDFSATSEDQVNNNGLLTSLGHYISTSYISPSADVGSYTWDLESTGLKICGPPDIATYILSEALFENTSLTLVVDLTANYDITYGKVSAEITERTVYVIPELTPSIDGKIYDNDHFYADKITEYVATSEVNTGLLAGHSLSLKNGYGKYIRTAGVDVGEDQSLNFYKHSPLDSSDTISGIEEILSFSGGAKAKNYNVVFCGTQKENCIEGNVAVDIIERPIYVYPTAEEPDMIYDNDYFYADGILAETTIYKDPEYSDAVANPSDYSLGLVTGHSIKLKSGDALKKYIRTEGVNVKDGYTFNFYPDSAVTDIEQLIDFENGAKAENYKVFFKGTEKAGYIEGNIRVNIKERSVYIRPTSAASKVYDADYLYATGVESVLNPNIATNEQGFVLPAHTVTLKENDRHIRTASTDVTEEGDELTLNFYSDGLDIESCLDFSSDLEKSNYKIIFYEGDAAFYSDDVKLGTVKVKITPRDITLYPHLTYSDATLTYNGDKIGSYITSDLSEGNEKNSWSLANGKTFTVSATFGNYSDAGSYIWELNSSSDIVINHLGEPVTDNFNIKYETSAPLIISKREIALSPALSHGGTYNGVALQSDIKYSSGGSESNTWTLGTSNVFTVSAALDDYYNVGNYNYQLLLVDNKPKAVLTYTKLSGTSLANFEKSSDIVITMSEKNVTDNFIFNFAGSSSATKTISKREVHLTATVDSTSKIYDNDYFYADGIAVKTGYSLVSGHTVLLSDTNYIRSDGVDAKSYELKFIPSGSVTKFEDIITLRGTDAYKDNYNFKYSVPNEVAIQKRDVFVKPVVTSSNVYNGQYVYASAVTVLATDETTGLLKASIHGVASDHALVYTESSQALVSEKKTADDNIQMTVAAGKDLNSAVNFTSGSKDNYNIKLSPTETVSITITKLQITVTPTVGSYTKTYDAEPFYATGITLSSGSALADGQSMSYVSKSLHTATADVSSSLQITEKPEKNSDWIKITDEYGADVSANYSITYQSGDITVSITARPITLTPSVGSGEHIYDGKLYEPASLKIFSGSLADDGHKINLVEGIIKSSGTDVGTYELILPSSGVEWVTISGGDIKNYNITYQSASITIKPCAVTVSPNDLTVIYNGQKHVASDTLIYNTLAEGHDVSASNIVFSYLSDSSIITSDGFAGAPTGYSTATVSIVSADIVVTDAAGDTVSSSNYVFSLTGTSTLTVATRIMTVTPTAPDKTYDGAPIVCNSAKVTCSDGREYYVAVKPGHEKTSKDVKVGLYQFNLTRDDIEIYDAETDENVTDQCLIEFTSGIASITQRTVYVVTSSAQKQYDGDNLTSYDFTLSPTGNDGDNGLVDPDDIVSIVLAYTGRQLNVGSSQNTADVSSESNPNYNVVIEYGTLTVTPFTFDLVIYSFERPYDGQYINGTEVMYAVENSTLSNVELNIRKVLLKYVKDTFDGEEDLEFTVYHNGVAVERDNYNLNIDMYGPICITQASISFRASSFTVNYDGKEHSDPEIECTSSIPQGHTFTGSATGSLVGNEFEETTVTNLLKAEHIQIFNEDGEVTENFIILAYSGTITIMPKK